jgi:hypothetical protein
MPTNWEYSPPGESEGCDSITGVTAPESLPTDLAAAHALILAERAVRLEAEAAAANAKAEATSAQADLSSYRNSDQPSQARDREAAADTLRHALGAQSAIAGADGA